MWTIFILKILFVAVSSLSFSTQAPCGGSVDVAHRLSCPTVYGIFPDQRLIEAMSSGLAGGFLTAGTPGKSKIGG